MNQHIESIFYDIPIHENAKNFFETLLTTKEERTSIAQNLLDFYLNEYSLDFNLTDNLKQDYLNAIHLLLISFAYMIVIKEEELFNQFCRRFIFESKKDSQEVFALKKFFLSNFDSREEYHIASLTSHGDIKKRIDIILLKYIQFFSHYS